MTEDDVFTDKTFFELYDKSTTLKRQNIYVKIKNEHRKIKHQKNRFIKMCLYLYND
jgi:hypothetical protein